MKWKIKDKDNKKTSFFFGCIVRSKEILERLDSYVKTNGKTIIWRKSKEDIENGDYDIPIGYSLYEGGVLLKDKNDDRYFRFRTSKDNYVSSKDNSSCSYVSSMNKNKTTSVRYKGSNKSSDSSSKYNDITILTSSSSDSEDLPPRSHSSDNTKDKDDNLLLVKPKTLEETNIVNALKTIRDYCNKKVEDSKQQMKIIQDNEKLKDKLKKLEKDNNKLTLDYNKLRTKITRVSKRKDLYKEEVLKLKSQKQHMINNNNNLFNQLSNTSEDKSREIKRLNNLNHIANNKINQLQLQSQSQYTKLLTLIQNKLKNIVTKYDDKSAKDKLEKSKKTQDNEGILDNDEKLDNEQIHSKDIKILRDMIGMITDVHCSICREYPSFGQRCAECHKLYCNPCINQWIVSQERKSVQNFNDGISKDMDASCPICKLPIAIWSNNKQKMVKSLLIAVNTKSIKL